METLKMGSRGETVKALQEALGLHPDGIFGTDTTVGVCLYQRDNGLEINGRVDSDLQMKLGLKK